MYPRTTLILKARKPGLLAGADFMKVERLIRLRYILTKHIITDGPQPAVLQEVSLPIINNTECEAMYEKAGFKEHIPHTFICAGYSDGGKDSCEVRLRTFTFP